ncbi:MAG TPA: hypothetical protein VMW50_03905, partial [Dehalococcoidia bacterium]|nr:hypothetical protein [Dehalococcoidia bacterium]
KWNGIEQLKTERRMHGHLRLTPRSSEHRSLRSRLTPLRGVAQLKYVRAPHNSALWSFIVLKMTIVLCLFFLLAALIWALGLRQDDEAILKYLVFTTQLLYGSALYDLLKSLRAIPAGDKFWVSMLKVVGEASAWMLAALVLLLLAAKVFFLAYVGLFGAILAYGCIFVRVLPKLQPLYIQAQNRVPKSKL